MMMAYDSSQTPASRLDDDTITALRAALQQYLSNPDSPSALQAALLATASEAREKSILPEHLLVVLKDLWGNLPEVRLVSDAREQVKLLQRVVTMSIKEYYSG
jgi:alpha-ketoglutarate-dependent taurine dioxygenase